MTQAQQQQQHLRTLRRSLNRAVTTLKGDDSIIVNVGWGVGRVFGNPKLRPELGLEWPEESEDLHLLFPSPEGDVETAVWRDWGDLIPEELRKSLDFFWPGPLVVQVRCPRTRRRVKICCPWHPLMKELLSRHGCVFWSPMGAPEERDFHERGGDLERFGRERVLVWPEREVVLAISLLDTGTSPWRLMERGFVEADELFARIPRPVLLSDDRAFPARPLRTFQPQHRTVILEAAAKDDLPRLVEEFRAQLGPEWAVRIYLDESVAHKHFPDDRGVRVYGEMSDPERVRRRLEAMLERQRRRSGKRVLLIGIAELDGSADSLKTDLEKLAQYWFTIGKGEALELNEFL